jgi:ADP-ribose pyrophosphatase YjhB (NUDIX family)
MPKKCGFALVDTEGNFLTVRENSTPVSKWGFPKGKIETYDEDESACRIRELREEVGIDISKLKHRIVKTDSYSNCKIAITKIGCSCDKITITLSSEIQKAMWLPLEQLVKDFQKTPNDYNSSIKAIIGHNGQKSSDVINELKKFDLENKLGSDSDNDPEGSWSQIKHKSSDSRNKLKNSGSHIKLNDSGSRDKLKNSGSHNKLNDSGSRDKLKNSGSHNKLKNSGSYNRFMNFGSVENI